MSLDKDGSVIHIIKYLIYKGKHGTNYKFVGTVLKVMFLSSVTTFPFPILPFLSIFCCFLLELECCSQDPRLNQV